MSDDIRNRLRTEIAAHLGVDVDQVTDEKSIVDDLGADSLDAVEIVMMVEEKFGIEIPDDEAEKFVTVGDVANFVESKA
jgi:acyl carrier protein